MFHSLAAKIYLASLTAIIFIVVLPIFASFEAQDFITLIQTPYYHNVLLFSLQNAGLTLAISLLLGAAACVVLEIYFPDFKRFFHILGAICLVLPAVIVTFGWQRLFHFAQPAIQLLGVKPADAQKFFYGSGGIVLVYVYYNLPLVLFTLGARLDQIPTDYLRLAKHLGFCKLQLLKFIYWPIVKASIPNIAFLVFLFCFHDFAVSYLLGGGPANTSLPTAIYQTLIYDSNLTLAAATTLLQMMPAIFYLLFLLTLKHNPDISLRAEAKANHHHQDIGLTGKILASWLPLAVIFFALAPFFGSGVASMRLMADNKLKNVLTEFIAYPSLISGVANSIKIALTSGFLASLTAYFHLAAARKLKTKLSDHLPWLFMIFPQIILGLGMFIVLHRLEKLNFLSYWPIIAILNSLVYFPLLIYFWKEPFLTIRHSHRHLLETLGLNSWQIFIYLDWPALRNIFLLGFSVVATLALGDLTLISLFGTPFETITTLYRNFISHYKFESATLLQIVFATIICLFFVPSLILQIKKYHQP